MDQYKRRQQRLRESGARDAYTIVGRAIRLGEMAPVHGQDCADCGKPAVHYDHRDYGRPLDVQPVCRRCNCLRGPAIWRDPLHAGPIKP